MNVMQQAQRAYSTGTAPIKSGRQIEYEAFARVTRRLRTSDANKDTDYAEFAMALHQNRQLWTILAADVSDPENSLQQKKKLTVEKQRC